MVQLEEAGLQQRSRGEYNFEISLAANSIHCESGCYQSKFTNVSRSGYARADIKGYPNEVMFGAYVVSLNSV